MENQNCSKNWGSKTRKKPNFCAKFCRFEPHRVCDYNYHYDYHYDYEYDYDHDYDFQNDYRYEYEYEYD